MATKSMSYDHPAYLARYSQAGTFTAGASTTFKFCAFTNMVIKSVTLNPIVLSTVNDIVTAVQILAAGGSTNTQVLSTFTAVQTAGGNFVMTAANTLAQGDEFKVTKGTDALMTYDIAVEYVLVPGANVTV